MLAVASLLGVEQKKSHLGSTAINATMVIQNQREVPEPQRATRQLGMRLCGCTAPRVFIVVLRKG